MNREPSSGRHRPDSHDPESRRSKQTRHRNHRDPRRRDLSGDRVPDDSHRPASSSHADRSDDTNGPTLTYPTMTTDRPAPMRCPPFGQVGATSRSTPEPAASLPRSCLSTPAPNRRHSEWSTWSLALTADQRGQLMLLIEGPAAQKRLSRPCGAPPALLNSVAVAESTFRSAP